MEKGVCQLPNPDGAANELSCVTDLGCASGLCVASQCRAPCSVDADCGAAGACLGAAQVNPTTGAPLGVAAVCDFALQPTGV